MKPILKPIVGAAYAAYLKQFWRELRDQQEATTMKRTPTKWAGKKLTKDQQKAQRKWRRAVSELVELHEILHTTIFRDRKHLHERLDRRLDAIERQKNTARELFPEVEESFTTASMRVRL